MAHSLSYLLCVTLFFFISTTSLNPIPTHAAAVKRLFVFGDSLFDPGNNQYLAGGDKSPATSWPYGLNFNNHSTGRLSDGRLVPDFIAQFANLHMVPPFLEPGADYENGTSFASAGAGCLEIHSGVMNIKAQLNDFKTLVKSMKGKMGNEEAMEAVKRSVFLFSMGGNDYFSFNTDNPNATESQRRQFERMVIGNLTSVIKEIYRMGGRNFGFQNVGPLGCLPMIKQMYPELKGGCNEKFLTHAHLHNKALSNALHKLSTNLPGFHHAILDYYYALGDRINNPSKYGFKVGKISCCGNGDYNGKGCGGGSDGKTTFKLCNNASEYVFFDGGHTTENTNHQLAQLLWSGVPNVTGPYNMKQLFELA